MKRLIFPFFFAASLSSAVAADAPAPSAPPPVPFAPVVLDQADMKSLTDYVGTLPFNQAAPIMQFLSQKEAEAQKRNEKK